MNVDEMVAARAEIDGLGLGDVPALAQGSEAWRAARGAGIGGSEVAALYPNPRAKTGTHHPWLSEYKLWALKTGRLRSPPATLRDAPHLWLGQKLEPVVREAYQELTGYVVKEGSTMLRHPELACMIANTDGEIEAVDERGPGVFEGKTTTFWSKDDWADGKTPIYYQAQTQHYMACTGLLWAGVIVFIQGQRGLPFLTRVIERNDAFIERMLERIDKWWTRHVINDEPPEVDGSEQTKDAIADIFPEPTVERIAMSEKWISVRDRLSEVKSNIRELEAEKSTLENKIRAAIGEAEYGELPDGTGWSLKTTHRKGYTKVVKPATFRQLRIVKDMEKIK